jgi:hypothetical protein
VVYLFNFSFGIYTGSSTTTLECNVLRRDGRVRNLSHVSHDVGLQFVDVQAASRTTGVISYDIMDGLTIDVRIMMQGLHALAVHLPFVVSPFFVAFVVLPVPVVVAHFFFSASKFGLRCWRQ